MRSSLKLLSLLLACGIILSPALGSSIPVRSASGLGSGSFTFAACLVGTTPDACEEFGSFTSGVSVTGLGGTFTVTQFVFGNGSPGTLLNVIDLGSISAGTTFTLPSLFFQPGNTDVFGCGDGNTAVVDSGSTIISSLCTALSNPLGPTDLVLNGNGSFTTGINFADLVLASPVPPTTPEPSSILLLGLGTAAIGGIRRRWNARSAN